jgi:flagellar hook assembly protein FlgD
MPADLSLKIYDVTGRKVRTLVEGNVEPGYHRIAWDGKDDGGRHVSSGIYHLRMVSAEFVSTRRITAIR